MRGEETIGVGQKGIETGVGAEVNDLAAILGLRKKFRIGAEDTSAQRGEGGALDFTLGFGDFSIDRHWMRVNSNRFLVQGTIFLRSGIFCRG